MSEQALSHGTAFSVPDMLGVDPLWVATGILVIVYAALITEKRTYVDCALRQLRMQRLPTCCKTRWPLLKSRVSCVRSR